MGWSHLRKNCLPLSSFSSLLPPPRLCHSLRSTPVATIYAPRGATTNKCRRLGKVKAVKAQQPPGSTLSRACGRLAGWGVGVLRVCALRILIQFNAPSSATFATLHRAAPERGRHRRGIATIEADNIAAPLLSAAQTGA